MCSDELIMRWGISGYKRKFSNLNFRRRYAFISSFFNLSAFLKIQLVVSEFKIMGFFAKPNLTTLYFWQIGCNGRGRKYLSLPKKIMTC